MLVASLIIVTVVIIIIVIILIIIIPKIIIIVATSLVELADHIHAHTAEGVRACDSHIGVVVLQVDLGEGGITIRSSEANIVNYEVLVKVVGESIVNYEVLAKVVGRSSEGRRKVVGEVVGEVVGGLCLNLCITANIM
jgi:hypothetical protein